MTMGFFAFFGSMMIGGTVGFLFEKWNITHNGLIPSVMIALGAVFIFFMVRATFGLSFGSPGVDAIIGASAALILIPTEAARKRRGRRK